eukprot:gb/GEZN01002868.1/.p1 GENE.gb/GEZN01002868.1/~~gb/GEZN01002868.1/.p1  ORF type:complete len:620 (-),score=42.55 gb/GEZN01002868.1/:446-2305(-)
MSDLSSLYLRRLLEEEGEEEQRYFSDEARIVVLVTSSVSLVVSAALILLSLPNLALRDTRPFYVISTHLLIAAFLNAVSWISSDTEGNCVFAASLRLYSSLVALCIVSVSSSMALILVDGQRATTTKMWQQRFQNKWLVVCWTTPLFLVVVGFATDTYGAEQYWCWLSQDHLLVRFLVFDVPLCLALLWNIGSAFYLQRRRRVSDIVLSIYRGPADMDLKRMTTQIIYRVLMRTAVFSVCFVWLLLDDVFDAWAPQLAIYIEIPSVFISPCFALCTSILFVRDVPWVRNFMLTRFGLRLSPSNSKNSKGQASQSGMIGASHVVHRNPEFLDLGSSESSVGIPPSPGESIRDKEGGAWKSGSDAEDGTLEIHVNEVNATGSAARCDHENTRSSISRSSNGGDGDGESYHDKHADIEFTSMEDDSALVAQASNGESWMMLFRSQSMPVLPHARSVEDQEEMPSLHPKSMSLRNLSMATGKKTNSAAISVPEKPTERRSLEPRPSSGSHGVVISESGPQRSSGSFSSDPYVNCTFGSSPASGSPVRIMKRLTVQEMRRSQTDSPPGSTKPNSKRVFTEPGPKRMSGLRSPRRSEPSPERMSSWGPRSSTPLPRSSSSEILVV